MNNEKLISVIIPVYNAEKYLEECLESVLEQTYRNMEIILVNDGSEDSSGEICRRYCKKDSRIVLIEQENAGVAAARNVGVSVATGEYLLFVDADDVLSATICENTCARLQEFDVLAFAFESFCESAEIAEKRISKGMVVPQKYCGEEWLRDMLSGDAAVLAGVNPNTVWGKFYRRSFLESYQVSCQTGILIGEDMLFNVQVYMHEPKIGYLPVKGYFYRTNPTSVVHRYNPRFLESDRKFYEELKIILDKKQLWETYLDGIQYQRVNGMLMAFVNDIFHPDNPKSEREKKADFLELVRDEDVQTLIHGQLQKFGLLTRCVLMCARCRWFYSLSFLYMAKNWIRKFILQVRKLLLL